VAGGRDGSATELWGMARDAMGETLAVHDTWVVANTTSGAAVPLQHTATPPPQRRHGHDAVPVCVCAQVCRMATSRPGAASVASFLAAVLTEIYLCNVCYYQEVSC
jgi:hypothetical protein